MMTPRSSFFTLLLGASALLSACATTQTTEKPAEKTAYRAPPDEPWRTTKPAASATAESPLPTFETAKLPTGLNVMVVANNKLPIVHVQIALDAGSRLDPKGKAGLARLSMQMLKEGAGKRDKGKLAFAFADLGAELSVGTGRDSSVLNVAVLKRNLPAALALLNDVLTKPRLPKSGFARLKRESAADMKARLSSPRAQAADTMAEALYGADHPYGHPTIGTHAGLEQITARDVRRFLAANVRPQRAAVVLAGDVTSDEATALVKTAFGRWRAKPSKVEAPAAPAAASKTRVILVDQPGAPQSVVSVGRVFMASGNADEVPAILMNRVLGGSFTSRLNMNLREDKGWTYGARSVVDTRVGAGPFVASAQVRADATAPSVQEIVKEFSAMTGERPITADELKNARQGMLRGIPGQFQTVGAAASAGGYMFVYGRPANHYDVFTQAIKTTAAEDVMRVATDALTSQPLTFVIVGDATSLAPQLKALELAEVEVVPARVP